jgi:hypothetical protein
VGGVIAPDAGYNVSGGDALSLPGDPSQPFWPTPEPGALDRKLCQVVGLNQNYTSSSGTLYHIQIEDRGPVLDRVSEREVRRVNLIVYANYGEANARIIWGHDHDLPDVRSKDHNAFVSQQIQELAVHSRRIIEERESRLVARIKSLIREYYLTKDEAHKREFEEANATFPFLFSKAWMELKREKATEREQRAPIPVATPAPPPPEEADEGLAEVLYPLDAELREAVIEIERLIHELTQDLGQLKLQGQADDILIQTCRKLVSRAKESVSGHESSEFSMKRLEVMRNSLMTTWRQVRSRLKA